MRIEEMIAAVQQAVGVSVDGRAGTETWGAIYAALVKKKIDGQPPAQALAAVDDRSERTIATLLPQVQPMARALVAESCRRQYPHQNHQRLAHLCRAGRAVRTGRTKPGKVVTNARGGYSNHNFGIAFDIGVFEGSRYLPDDPKYKAVGALGIDLGLEWGGNWKGFTDQPHYQLRPLWAVGMRERDTLAELRKRKAEGRGAYAD
jgi:peptidoglycan LD-endopeptidase CwlK